MTSGLKITGACLAGLGAVLATRLICNMACERRKLEEKKFIKEAVCSWEGEGGNILEPCMRAAGY